MHGGGDIQKHVKELKRGSYSAFQHLYDIYFGNLYGFVFSLTRSRTLAQDVVQDTFIKAWTHREVIDASLPFKSWLFAVAKNRLADLARRQLSNPLFEDYLQYAEDESLSIQEQEQSFDFDAFRSSLERAKSKLSPRQSEVFSLCKELGYSVKEVSERLHISEQSVHNYLSQALKLLRKDMLPYYSLFLIFFH